MSGEQAKSGNGAPRDHSDQVQGSAWASLHQSSDLFFTVLIAVAVITAVLLRWSGLGSQSLWLDEGYTFWISRFSPTQIWHILEQDTSSPLFYVLLHYWSACFGTSEFSLRALSALFATLSIPLFYQLARRILADRAAVALAMMLYAVSFFQIWYAKEARCYALLVLLSLGSLYWLLLFLENRSMLRLCGLVLFLTATLYTHNIALFYLPGIVAVWLLYPAVRTILGRVKDALLAFSAVLLLYIPWLPHLRRQVHGIHVGRMVQVPAPRARDLLESLCSLSGFDAGTLQTIFRGLFHTLHLFGFWTWAPAVLIIFVFCILGGVWAVRSAERRKVAALLMYSLTPLFLVFIDSLVSNPIYVNRLFLGSCVLLPLVFCAPVAFQAGKRKKVFQTLGLFLLVGTAVSAVGYLRRERKEDWRGATEYLMKLPEKRRLLLVVPDTGQALVQYYASEGSKAYPPIDMIGLLTRYDPPDPSLEARLLENFDRNADVLERLSQAVESRRYKEIDLVMEPGAWPAFVTPTRQYLAEHCTSDEIVEFHWLEVRRCLLPSAPRN